MQIIEVLKSKNCWLVMLIWGLFSYLLLQETFAHGDIIIKAISALFIFVLSLVIACTIKTVVSNSQKKSQSLRSLANGIIGLIGIIATQTCLASGVCAITLTTAILSTILPLAVVNIFEEYSIHIIILSTLFLAYSLYSMKCFGKEN